MIKRSIAISSRSYISTQDEQLVVKLYDEEEPQRVPIEDVGFLELDSLTSTISVAALAKAASYGVVTSICDPSHHPVALVVPLVGNSIHAERFRSQVLAPEPTRKRAWATIVRCKIQNQADALKLMGHPHEHVARRAKLVRTGDGTSQESAAAAAYWKHALGHFRTGRDPDGTFPNNVLNYGYAVIRAAVARGLVEAGLHPALGVQHSNRYNAFALADDVMEPFRPWVDVHVLPYAETMDEPELRPTDKRHILGVLTLDAHTEGGRLPLMNAIQRSCVSMVRTFDGTIQRPSFPRLCG